MTAEVKGVTGMTKMLVTRHISQKDINGTIVNPSTLQISMLVRCVEPVVEEEEQNT